ncbi:hypothetical protein H9L39_17943 [Fusarium oxysporum f. sp. albedinis]|nr:hypothetical protein H9L39_17943 [Fusarium oxysporum f. sp. albedinis]
MTGVQTATSSQVKYQASKFTSDVALEQMFGRQPTTGVSQRLLQPRVTSQVKPLGNQAFSLINGAISGDSTQFKFLLT